MDDQTASCVSSGTEGCSICSGRTLLYSLIFSKTISYRVLALSKLSASDKWSNPIRAELLKASYLPLDSQAS